MKLFYTKHHNDYLHFIKAEDAAQARAFYLEGYPATVQSRRKDDVLTEVDCLETLIDLLPNEFQASEEF